MTGGDSVLTGLDFEDTSGETYVHDGAFDRDGNLLKLRYPVGHVTLNAFYLGGTNRSSPLCDQWVTILPCGYGPGGTLHSASHQVNLSAQGQIGNVIVSSGGFFNAYSSLDDELSRVVAGVPSPYRADTAGRGAGLFTYATLALHRHTRAREPVAFPRNGADDRVGRVPRRLRSQDAVRGRRHRRHAQVLRPLEDDRGIRAQPKSGRDALGGRHQPDAGRRRAAKRSRLGIGQYGNGANYVNSGFFGDPSGAQYDCESGQVRVQGPADTPVAGTSDSAQINYSRRGKRGSIRIGAYDNVDRGGNESTLFPLLALSPSEIPAGYVDQIAAFFHGSTICGAQTFNPGRIFVNEQIAGTTVRNRGVDASGQIVLGRAVILLPSYSISSSSLISSDPRLLYPGSPYAPGAQVPFAPLHKAGLLIDAVQPRARLEYVVNGTWLSANNANALGPYITVAAGATWRTLHGNLSAFVNNLFQADTGLFASGEFAQPLLLRGGGSYVPVPILLGPRSFTILYSVRAGRTK